MVVLKCKMCGGDIELPDDNNTRGVCGSCGSVTTRPKACNDQRAALFNRGNLLRMHGEYDKAAAVFEKIVEQDMTDAEAYWCLVLCRYGIEYVENPKTGERAPTCYRMSYDLLINDVDYITALENSDSRTAELYVSEAKKITEMQKAIIVISRQVKPYDIIINHKEPVDDSVARDIYNELTNGGYRVFLTCEALENKPESEHEPYIFAALNSAKVMLTVGTAPEHFNEVWVRNDWNRFLSRMKKDRGLLLIPCYRDMSPRELPDELSMFQAYDMGEPGFLKNLTKEMRKMMGGAAKSGAGATEAVILTDIYAKTTEEHIRQANDYLKKKQYANAYSNFSAVTTYYAPKDHRAWWGMILSSTGELSVRAKTSDRLDELFKKEWYDDDDEIPPLDKWLQSVKKYAPPEEFAALEQEYEAYKEKLVREKAEADRKKVETDTADVRKSGVLESPRAFNSRIALMEKVNEGDLLAGEREWLEAEKIRRKESYGKRVADFNKNIAGIDRSIRIIAISRYSIIFVITAVIATLLKTYGWIRLLDAFIAVLSVLGR